MTLIVAFVFVALGIVTLVMYSGTPHSGPTTDCGPISLLGNHFTLSADCRYVSAAELALAAVLIALGILIALSARPSR